MPDAISTNKPNTNNVQKPPVAINPKSQLDSQAFMKLLLTELQMQDPTAPMDTEKMLTQTAQLAALESQNNTNALMKELAAQINSQANSNTSTVAITAIGKYADMGDVQLMVDAKSHQIKFDLHFTAPVESGTISIKDESDKVVATIPVEKGVNGTKEFVWDLRDAKGNRVENGAYKVEASWSDEKQATHKSYLGVFPVESVRFKEGMAMLKLGNKYVPMSDIKEFSIDYINKGTI